MTGVVVMDRKWWALAGVAVAVFAVGVDGTVLAVALPTLAPQLHASATDLVWFSSAYLLTWAAAMLPLGSLGDRYGRRRVMLASLTAFGAASAWAAWSGSAAMFIAARAVGGVAGAGIVVMAMSAVTVMFAEEERSRAVGVWAGVNFLALPTGPILGGWLLDRFWWGWVFLINMPVVVIALVAVVTLVPESRAPRRGRLDLVGMTLFGAGLAGLVYGFAEAGTRGWGSAVVIAALLAGALLVLVFALWQRRLTRALPASSASTSPWEPLVDVGLFRIPDYVWGTVLAFLCSLTMIGVLFTLPQYFQAVLGVDSIGSGLRLFPLLGGLAVGAIGAEALTRTIGAKVVLVGGFAALGAGLVLGSETSPGSGFGFVSSWTSITGAGIGVVLATATAAALGRIPVARAGVASALIQALQDAGSPFGAAVLGTTALASYRSHLDLSPAMTGLTPAQAGAARGGVFDGTALADRLHSPALLADVRSAFVDGLDTALLVCGGIAFTGALLALALFPRRATTASLAVAGGDDGAAGETASATDGAPLPSTVSPAGGVAMIDAARVGTVVEGNE
ncbi:MFS transporter [Frankia sp. AgB32]|uniref:MFS transporter n=1 Tax=Frankia sp. AgB32 TaxID=631119 RepID=UPI0020109919|nr:MFS transporter [Frankia sp. AgB32]MCK9895961.1 MFS transporter [Frankia sp. AgB32]